MGSVVSFVRPGFMPSSMERIMFQRENKSFESANDPIAGEMQGRVKLAAFPPKPGESVKSAQRRAASRLGLSFPRVRAIWYALAKRIDAWEADLIRSRTAHLGELYVRLNDLEREMAQADRNAGQYALDLDGGEADRRGQLVRKTGE